MAKSLNIPFHFFILTSAVLLQLLGTRYISLNDLAVYAASIESEGIYEGDYSFEILQYLLSAIVGRDLVIIGMQICLLVLSVVYIYLASNKIANKVHMYIVAFLIFTSPVVLVGLTNSIRQSLAFILILIAFEIRKHLIRIALFGFAILMHKASLLLIPLIFMMQSLKNTPLSFPKGISDLKFALLLLLVVFSGVLFFNEIVEFLYQVYDRYSVYIYSAAVFTEGRTGSEKLIVWTLFWFVIVFMPALFHSSWRILIYPVVPLIFTLLVTLDANLRGFDEFHSRLLMFNNVFVLVWLIETTKRNNGKKFAFPIVLFFNLLNPATIGVLI